MANSSGTCFTFSPDFTNAWTLNSWVNGLHTTLNVAPTYQFFACERILIILGLAKMICCHSSTRTSFWRKSSGMEVSAMAIQFTQMMSGMYQDDLLIKWSAINKKYYFGELPLVTCLLASCRWQVAVLATCPRTPQIPLNYHKVWLFYVMELIMDI